jgi:hypothetical protein
MNADLPLTARSVPVLNLNFFLACLPPPFFRQYQPKYNDIFITWIADTAQSSSRFWGILLNYQ